MSVTIAEANTELAARGFDHIDSARRLDVLNWKLSEAADMFPWPFYVDEKTSAGGSITFPWTMTGYREILSIEQSDGRVIEWLDWRDGRRVEARDSTSTGPVRFAWVEPTVDAMELHVWPSPTTTVTLAAAQEPTALSGSTNIPGPEQFADAVIDAACAVFYREDGNAGMAQTYAEMSASKLGMLMKRFQNTQSAGGQKMMMNRSDESWSGGW